MNGYDIFAIMEEIAPKALACDWDHVGIMAGNPLQEISGIMLCLDLTPAVLEEAVSENCNMIITHHPLIFNPLTTLSEETPRGRFLCDVVRENILVFSAHTNLDYCEGGVNDSLLKQLGVSESVCDETGHHRFGDLPEMMTVREFASHVNDKLAAEGVRVILPESIDPEDYVKRVGVSCGSFDGETSWIYDCEVDVLVTGEIKHSAAVELEMEEFVTVTAGHYATEIWGVDGLAMLLGDRLLSEHGSDAPEVFVSSTSRNPLKNI